jgi:hypothetical protein
MHDYLLVPEQCPRPLLEKHEDPRPRANYKEYDQNTYKSAPSSVSQVPAPFTSATLQSCRPLTSAEAIISGRARAGAARVTASGNARGRRAPPCHALPTSDLQRCLWGVLRRLQHVRRSSEGHSTIGGAEPAGTRDREKGRKGIVARYENEIRTPETKRASGVDFPGEIDGWCGRGDTAHCRTTYCIC